MTTTISHPQQATGTTAEGQKVHTGVIYVVAPGSQREIDANNGGTNPALASVSASALINYLYGSALESVTVTAFGSTGALDGGANNVRVVGGGSSQVFLPDGFTATWSITDGADEIASFFLDVTGEAYAMIVFTVR